MCPCHGSIFDPANGAEVVSGPSRAARFPPCRSVSKPMARLAVAGDFDGPVGPQ